MSSPSGLQPFSGGNRFATITPNDHGGVIWVASILCAIFSLLAFALRCYTKRKYFGLDDWVAAAATVTALAQYIAVFVATSKGLGKAYGDFSTSGIEDIGKATLASQIFFLLSLGLAKISLILLIRRLFSPDMVTYLITCDVVLVLSALWGLGSILGIAVHCSPLHLMGPEKTFCSDLVMRWKAIGAIDAITELLAVSMSAAVVWRLQMKMERKARVVVAFLPRLPVVIFAALHIHFTNTFTHKPNTGVALAAPMVYQQLELCYSLISLTIPNLKGYLSFFDTGGLGLGFAYSTAAYGSQTISLKLSSLKNSAMRSKGRSSTHADAAAATGKFRPDPVFHKSSIVHDKDGGTTERRQSNRSQEDQSTESINSQEMIIRRDVQWNVRYD